MNINKAYLTGFRSFQGFEIKLSSLEVIVGPNGSGKSSFFDFLLFLRESVFLPIPPEIIHMHAGRSFFSGNEDVVTWDLQYNIYNELKANYFGKISGPIGKPSVFHETVSIEDKYGNINFNAISSSTSEVLVIDSTGSSTEKIDKKPNQLSLQLISNAKYNDAISVKYIIGASRFFSSFRFKDSLIRRSTLVEQEPSLNEDCSNLSSVLHYLMTEHPQIFNEIQFHLKSLVPGFSHLTVKARGGPGEVMAFWREQGVEQDLSLADLSDGILRLLCWMVLFLHPKPPTLICIDEPDLGVHPRTLPLLAGLIKKASVRTQIFVTTHNSYFLSQFDLENITVFRKENGATKAHKPKDSKTLVELLEEFGQGEIAAMHISEELELL